MQYFVKDQDGELKALSEDQFCFLADCLATGLAASDWKVEHTGSDGPDTFHFLTLNKVK
jgi:hypothetical protein